MPKAFSHVFEIFLKVNLESNINYKTALQNLLLKGTGNIVSLTYAT